MDLESNLEDVACAEKLVSTTTEKQNETKADYASLTKSEEINTQLETEYFLSSSLDDFKLKLLHKRRQPKWGKVKRKKWKTLSSDYLSFCPAQLARGNPTEEEEWQMEQEFLQFQDQVSRSRRYLNEDSSRVNDIAPVAKDTIQPDLINTSDICVSMLGGEPNTSPSEKCCAPVEIMCDLKKTVAPTEPSPRDLEVMDNVHWRYYLQDSIYYDDMNVIQEQELCDYPNVLPTRDSVIITYIEECKVCHLRRKNKWHDQKAHKQVKTKKCGKVSNGSRGKKLHISHRVVKKMPMQMGARYKIQVSYRKIDKYKGMSVKDWRMMKKGHQQGESVTSSYVPSGRSNQVRGSRQRSAPTTHTLNAYNADGDLTPDLVNLLINIQDRELTPEDYEMLLRLDERVAPKTVDRSLLEKLHTDTVTDDAEEKETLCTVCMDKYEWGDLRKHLPCGHHFHVECIDNWLSNQSTNCPLDGTPVFP